MPLRLERSTCSQIHCSPDFAAITPCKVSSKNHCTHQRRVCHVVFWKDSAFLWLMMCSELLWTQLKWQDRGQGAGLYLEECTEFQWRLTSEKIQPQVCWELLGWGRGEHMGMTDSWSRLPGGKKQLRKASWTRGSLSWGWKASRNVLGQCFRQIEHSDPAVLRWRPACCVQGTTFSYSCWGRRRDTGKLWGLWDGRTGTGDWRPIGWLQLTKCHV